MWRRSGEVQNDTSVVWLSTLKVLPRFHPLGSVPPSAMAHNFFFLKKKNINIQHLFMCGRRLQDVAASLQQGVEQPSELPILASLDMR